MRKWLTAVIAVLAFAPLAQAAPLDAKQVGADAKWVGHVDVDAMRASTVVVRSYEWIVDKHPEAARLLDLAHSLIGMDLRTDLHGVTVYGKVVGRPDGVLIVSADVDRAMLLDKAKLAPDYKATEYGSHTIHSWVQDQGKRHEHAAAGAFYKPSVLVFAPSVAEVQAALDVLDGKKPCLAPASPLAAAVPAGATLVGRIIDLSSVQIPCQSPIVTQSDRVSVAMGENNSESFFESVFVAKNHDVAEQVKTVLEGGRALALLQHGQDPDAVEFVGRLKVNVSDKTVTVAFRAPADDVLEALHWIAEEVEQHHHMLMDHAKPHAKGKPKTEPKS